MGHRNIVVFCRSSTNRDRFLWVWISTLYLWLVHLNVHERIWTNTKNNQVTILFRVVPHSFWIPLWVAWTIHATQLIFHHLDIEGVVQPNKMKHLGNLCLNFYSFLQFLLIWFTIFFWMYHYVLVGLFVVHYILYFVHSLQPY